MGLPPRSPVYGAGFGAAVSNGGIIVCGGEENIWEESNDFKGGKVSRY